MMKIKVVIAMVAFLIVVSPISAKAQDAVAVAGADANASSGGSASANSTNNNNNNLSTNITGDSYFNPPPLLKIPHVYLPNQYASEAERLVLFMQGRSLTIPKKLLFEMAKDVSPDREKIYFSGQHAYAYLAWETKSFQVDPHAMIGKAWKDAEARAGGKPLNIVRLDVFQNTIKVGYGFGGSVGGAHTDSATFRSSGVGLGIIPSFAKAFPYKGCLVRVLFQVASK